MSPEEHQLLQGVFDRMRNNATAQRDPDADRLITDNVRQQPYSPYYLTQAVIVQEQALQAANQRIQQLEQQAPQSQPSGGGGFLSSIFGGGAAASREPMPAQRPPVWNQGGSTQAPPSGYGQPQGYGQQQGYAPPPQGGPWSGQPQQAPMGGGGGGFLKGALGTAAGVAGGALMFEGIRGLMGGHGGGFGGLGMGTGVPGVPQETVVNNYYGDGSGGGDAGGGTAADWQQDADQDQDDAQDAGDYSGGGDDGSYDV